MQRTVFLVSFLVFASALLSVSWLEDQRRKLFRKGLLPPTPQNSRRAMSSPQSQPQDSGREFEVPDFIDPTGLTKEELKLISWIHSLESSYVSPSAIKPSSNAR